MSRIVRSLDGHDVALELEGGDLSGVVTATACYVGVDRGRPGGEVEFTSVGLVDAGEELAADAGVDLTDKLEFSGGSLLVGAGAAPPAYPEGEPSALVVGVWRGTSHSVHFQLFDATVADAVTFVDPLEIEETADGVVLATLDRSRLQRSPRRENVFIGVADMGLLQTAARAGPLGDDATPAWAGTMVAGGELYVDEVENPDTGQRIQRFLLAGESAETWVLPDTALPESVPEHLLALRVDWS